MTSQSAMPHSCSSPPAKRLLLLGLALSLPSLFATHAAAQSDLVPLGSTWRYLDDGSNQGSAWRAPAFDDSGWASGPAELGYGDGDEATVVSFGGNSSNKFITTYFRHAFSVADPQALTGLLLEVQRDDGVVVYLNGTEVFRDNLPGGTISSGTLASVAVGGADESTLLSAILDPGLIVAGPNVVAAEIHQANATSSDISFNLRLADEPPPATALVRGPYLQRANSNQVTVKWRTNVPTSSLVQFGLAPDNLEQSASDPTSTTEHEVTVSGLTPDTRYWYAIGDSSGELSSGSDHFFDTHPMAGTAAPTRIWVLGDSGTANAAAAAVRDAFLNFNGSTHADVWLMLGDNAYNDGTDAEYQAAVFDLYPSFLRSSVLWSTLGNHDGHTADSASQTGPYYDIFTFPTGAETGGVPSGTEAYYSFDYAHIHFVCLDSYETSRSPTGAMAQWLEQDLASTTQEWIIVFFHHPPYSKGSHNSDSETPLVEMRENFLPILDSYGVDLVLSGHSHSYERSVLIDGHYGNSSTFGPQHTIDGGDGSPSGSGPYQKAPAAHEGTVYAVAGSSGKISNAPLNHPVMIVNLLELGSMVIDVSNNVLNAVFLDDVGAVRDHFQIVHEFPSTDPPAAPSDLTATTLSASAISLAWTDNSDNEDGFAIERSLDGTSWAEVAVEPADATSSDDSGLSDDTLYHYRVVARNSFGDSPPSNVASAQTDPLPAFVDYFASSESTTAGTLTNNYTATHADDGTPEVVTEVESGGKPALRHSFLSHTWQIDFGAGDSATLLVNAWASASTDGDQFQFDYSLDGGSSWTPAFTVSSTDPAHTASAPIPSASGASLLVRVTDTDQTSGNRALDSVSVDEMRVSVSNGSSDPPLAPSNLSASATGPNAIALAWEDNSTDEFGFEIERLTAGDPTWTVVASIPSDTTGYEDTTVSANTSYDYRLRAYNAGGSSAWSNLASATTPDIPPPSMTLAASGVRVKGVITNTLTWSGATSADIDIFRNGTFLVTVPASPGTYVDDTGQNGSGTFTYVVCEAGNPLACSNEVTVTF